MAAGTFEPDISGDRPFGLLELGSNSLKFYLVGKAPGSGEPPSVKTVKFPWRIAHDFFLDGRIGERSMAEVVDWIRRVEEFAEGIPLESMLAVATGVFRELEEIGALANRILDETGVRVRVISGADEAKLMARDFHASSGGGSAFLFDLGGATMEWAWFDRGAHRNWGSLPLGAIRNEYLFRRHAGDRVHYVQASSAHIDAELRRLPFDSIERVVGTGGTAKAASRCCGSERVSIEAVRELMERVLRDGAPEDLKPARRAVFLPGLAILWRILVRCRAPARACRSGLITSTSTP
jgi:exopolyphosphatase/guanosine-5'-triphosphate,3'-diphosphate pyrophosphatase